MITLFLILFSYNSMAISPQIVLKNNKGVNLMESEKPLQGQVVLQNLTVNNPKLAVAHYNLGQAFERNKEVDKALKSYITSFELTQHPDLKFRSQFNIAKIYEQKKDTSKAIESYQKALDLNPNSIEAKTNIELLVASQSGGGGGGGQQDQKNPDQKQDQKGKGEQDKKQQKPKSEQGKSKKKDEKKNKQPQKFKSKALSERDVKKILEELKRQEDKIRAKMLNRKKTQESNVDKDW